MRYENSIPWDFSILQRYLKNVVILIPLPMKPLLTALFIFAFSTGIAQRNFDTVEIRTEKVADQIYVLFGAGGNMGLAIGDDAERLWCQRLERRRANRQSGTDPTSGS